MGRGHREGIRDGFSPLGRLKWGMVVKNLLAKIGE